MQSDQLIEQEFRGDACGIERVTESIRRNTDDPRTFEEVHACNYIASFPLQKYTILCFALWLLDERKSNVSLKSHSRRQST